MSAKYYPKIKFIIDLEQEKEVFLSRSKNIANFLPVGMSFVLKKEFIKNRNKILNAYLDQYYTDQHQYLTDSIKNTRAKWQKVEKIFFQKVDKLFHNWPWPKGNYRGYVSIGRMFPRDIKKKIFAFPLRSFKPGRENLDLRVIAHEMLHFIEYDYLQNKFGLKPSEIHSADNTFWQFTENLNVLIENSKFWREFSLGQSRPYPECKKLYKKMEKIWHKNKDIDNLIEKIFTLK